MMKVARQRNSESSPEFRAALLLESVVNREMVVFAEHQAVTRIGTKLLVGSRGFRDGKAPQIETQHLLSVRPEHAGKSRICYLNASLEIANCDPDGSGGEHFSEALIVRGVAFDRNLSRDIHADTGSLGSA